jgi:nucleoside-diphosphate-sugar epimerase
MLLARSSTVTTRARQVLILGGSGFVGANLVPALLVMGHEVTVLNRGNIPIAGTRQLIANRENPQELQEAAKNAGGFDVTIDTSSYRRAHTIAATTAFASRTRHWIHLGTAAVYKEKEFGFPNETDAIGGAAVWAQYGVEKADADQFLIHRLGGTPVTILRPPYLYGPRNSEDRETFVWARMLQNRPVIVPARAERRFSFFTSRISLAPSRW